jgi:cytoskeletal protein CcmA (bactofilin family)
MNKKIYLLLAVLAVLVMASPVSAATFKSGEETAVSEGNVIDDDLYIARGSVSVISQVKGDLMSAGGQVSINGDVSQDLIVGGGTVNVFGNVGDDARIGGGQINISGNIGDDLFVAGGTVNISKDTVVNGSLFLGAGSATVDGLVKGDSKIGGGTVILQGTFNGSMKIEAEEKLVISDGAVINGDLTYKSKKEAEISQTAVIKGKITFEERKTSTTGNAVKTFVPILGAAIIFKFLGSVFAGLILYFAIRNTTKRVVSGVYASFWMEILRGAIVLIVTPIACIILFVTTIGWMIGLALLFAWLAFIFASIMYVPVVLGHILLALLNKKQLIFRWWAVVLGALISLVLTFIPVLGWIVGFVFFLATAGSIANMRFKELKQAE